VRKKRRVGKTRRLWKMGKKTRRMRMTGKTGETRRSIVVQELIQRSWRRMQKRLIRLGR
jgi:hypothetical protein